MDDESGESMELMEEVQLRTVRYDELYIQRAFNI